MQTVPSELRQRLRKHGQEHALAWWDRLNDAERRGLIEQLQSIDLEQLSQLFAERVYIPSERCAADNRQSNHL